MKVDVEGKGGDDMSMWESCVWMDLLRECSEEDGDEREELRSWSGDIYQSIPPLLETLIPSLTRRARF